MSKNIQTKEENCKCGHCGECTCGMYDSDCVCKSHTKEECQCKYGSCEWETCKRKHTHKKFFCEICEPETCKKMQEPTLQTKIAEILHENFDYVPCEYAPIPESILSKTIEDIEKLVKEEIQKRTIPMGGAGASCAGNGGSHPRGN